MYSEFLGRMVVHEVERLQACYEMRAVRDQHLDLKVEQFLADYHIQQLKDCVMHRKA